MCGLEVDKAKIEVIKQILLPNNLKHPRGFLSHTSFYRRVIKDFAKKFNPLTNFIINGDTLKDLIS